VALSLALHAAGIAALDLIPARPSLVVVDPPVLAVELVAAPPAPAAGGERGADPAPSGPAPAAPPVSPPSSPAAAPSPRAVLAVSRPSSSSPSSRPRPAPAPVLAPQPAPLPDPAVSASSPAGSTTERADAPSAPDPGAGRPAGESAGAAGAGHAEAGPGRATEIDAYLAALQRAIQGSLVYPPAARRLRLSGLVRLRFSIAADGRIERGSLAVTGGSEDEILRQGALDTIRRLGTVPPPPPGPMGVEVPVNFFLVTSR